MLNSQSLQAVAASRINPHIGKPLYDSYCFSQIPQTIYHLLTGEGKLGLPADVLGNFPHRYNKVILLFVDAFGWEFYQRYQDKYPFLARFGQEGVASKLTTQFPSTTASHVTTIHSGLPIGDHGVCAWFYYEPQLDGVFAPLLYSFAGEKSRETVQKLGINPQSLFPTSTLYHRLQNHGVKSYCFQQQIYSHSSFSTTVCDGAQMVSYKTLPEAVTNLTDLVLQESSPAYYCLYVDAIDGICHKYSPNSPQFDAEVDSFFSMMEKLFHQTLTGNLQDTLILLTADHGQITATPETTIYLNKIYPTLANFLKTDAQNNPIIPGGGCRDYFLYVKEEYLEEVHRTLTEKLLGKATVWYTEKMLQEGYFGSNPSAKLVSRLGNIIILPNQNETIWWYEKNRFEMRQRACHGGLSPQEMETIFLAYTE